MKRFVVLSLAILAVLFTVGCGAFFNPRPPAAPTPTPTATAAPAVTPTPRPLGSPTADTGSTATAAPSPTPTEDPVLKEALKVIKLFCPGTMNNPIVVAQTCAEFFDRPLTFASCICRHSDATPTATATATPTPAATPTPTATSPTPTPAFCTPSTGECVHTNPGETGRYRKTFDQAMQATFTKYPQLFYPKGTSSCQWAVRADQVDNYFIALERELLLIYPYFCVQHDPHDKTMMNLKVDNTYSETFHPLRTDGDFPPAQCVSDINGIFSYHCAPAGF